MKFLPVRCSPTIFAFAAILIANLFGSGSTTFDKRSSTKFNVYWNVPTFMCHKYGIKFEKLKDFGIIQNTNDEFRGDQIAILYDPGMFPALHDKNGNRTSRNGGVPQEGNLQKHLDMYKKDLVSQIPSNSFGGIGVIDFESWRPIFRQNWVSLKDYQTESIKLEYKRHPFWSDAACKKEAKRRFEKAGRLFMEDTLTVTKKLRPNATWGYYGYPHCYNLTPGQSMHCERSTMSENDGMSWLFKLVDAHMPSVYLRLNIKEEDRTGFVKGRVTEAMRMAAKCQCKQQVLPYFWFKYQDKRDEFLTQKDVKYTIKTIAQVGADGMIIWGSSEDTNTEWKCKDLHAYVTDVLGPAVKSFVTE